MNLTARINALTVELRERGTIPCALLGRMARDTECCSRGLAATVKEFQTCRACPEGQRLAATAPLWGYSMPLPAPVIYTPPPTAPVAVPQKRLRGRTTLVMLDDMAFLPASTPAAKPKAPHPMMAMQEGQTAQQAKAPRPERPAKPVATCRECGWIKPRRCSWPEPDLCGACAPAAGPVRPRHLDKPVITRPPVQIPVAQATAPVVDEHLARLASALRELTADGRLRVSMLDLMRAVGAANYDEAAGLVIHAGLRTSQLSGPVQTVLVDHTARLLMASAASEVRQ